VAGIIEDPSVESDPPILIKLNTSTSTDYYLNFNLASSFNRGTREGANRVLITEQGGDGENYEQSWLVQKLSRGMK